VPFETLTDDDWDAAMAAKVTGPFLLTRGLARRWRRGVGTHRERGVAAGHARVRPQRRVRCVQGRDRLAHALDGRTLVVQGGHCNALMPGFVITPLTAEASKDPVRVAAMAGRTMVGRNGQPDDFHGVTLLLASDAGAMITGSMVYVDGGFAAT
jgi:gluconate 5-dehydrogenase